MQPTVGIVQRFRDGNLEDPNDSTNIVCIWAYDDNDDSDEDAEYSHSHDADVDDNGHDGNQISVDITINANLLPNSCQCPRPKDMIAKKATWTVLGFSPGVLTRPWSTIFLSTVVPPIVISDFEPSYVSHYQQLLAITSQIIKHFFVSGIMPASQNTGTSS